MVFDQNPTLQKQELSQNFPPKRTYIKGNSDKLIDSECRQQESEELLGGCVLWEAVPEILPGSLGENQKTLLLFWQEELCYEIAGGRVKLNTGM